MNWNHSSYQPEHDHQVANMRCKWRARRDTGVVDVLNKSFHAYRKRPSLGRPILFSTQSVSDDAHPWAPVPVPLVMFVETLTFWSALLCDSRTNKGCPRSTTTLVVGVRIKYPSRTTKRDDAYPFCLQATSTKMKHWLQAAVSGCLEARYLQ